MDNPEKIRDLLLEREQEGKVVFMTHEGLMEADIEDFIKQPTEGLLYDLNRDRGTVLAFIEDPTWINNFAVMLVIKKLKECIYQLNKQAAELRLAVENASEIEV